MRTRRAGVVAALACASLLACTSEATTRSVGDEGIRMPAEQQTARAVLEGRTIVLDPGHQLGNSSHPRQASRPVPAGGFTKPCNTSGTATDSGFPEATFNFRVAQRLRRQLERAGARVIMTRTRNSHELWGPCVDERGRRGNRVGADLKVSIHADGSFTDGRGFHVIAPTDRPPWTHDIHRSSALLARSIKRGLRHADFRPADYVAGGDGLDFRGDLGTLNLSDVPTVMVESGNMRNAREARVMRSRHGQYRYARGLFRGIRIFLSR
jgi:N-acetylmuramoyl-L-alanine amidase